MNGEFVKAQIKLAPKAQALADEYANLVWDERSTKREEHPGCENHLADAALYAWRHCYQYLSEKLQEPPNLAPASGKTRRSRRCQIGWRRSIGWNMKSFDG